MVEIWILVLLDKLIPSFVESFQALNVDLYAIIYDMIRKQHAKMNKRV